MDNKVILTTLESIQNKRSLLGADTSDSVVVLLDILYQFYDFVEKQKVLNYAEYKDYAVVLKYKIKCLEQHCSVVCSNNENIELDSNKITTLEITPNNFQVEFDKNVKIDTKNIFETIDVDKNLLDRIIYEDVSENLMLTSLGEEVLENATYFLKDLNVKYVPIDTQILVKNTNNSAICYQISLENANTVKDYLFVNDFSNTLYFQKIFENAKSIPSDSIIFVFVDTSIYINNDLNNLKAFILNWWEDFKLKNLNFTGHLISNIFSNTELGDNYALGRGSYGQVTLSNSSINKNNAKNWLNTPVSGLLSYLHKIGENTSMTLEEFYDKIKNLSLINIVFTDSSENIYHGTDTLNFQESVVVQQTTNFQEDYQLFTKEIKPRLPFFKGVVVPITNTNLFKDLLFTHHLYSSLEYKKEKILDIFEYLKSHFEQYNFQTASDFFNYLKFSPYTDLNLEKLGWYSILNLFGQKSNVLISSDFKNVFNEMFLNFNKDINPYFKVLQIPYTFSSFLTSEITYKVGTNKVFSNTVTSSVDTIFKKENVPTCLNTVIETEHDSTYFFKIEDFVENNTNCTILIKNIIGEGFLFYKDTNINVKSLPFALPIENVTSLKYITNTQIDTQYLFEIEYNLYFNKSINLSDTCYVNILKNKNKNIKPAIYVENVSLSLPNGITSIKVESDILYETEKYIIKWEKVSGGNIVLSNTNNKIVSLSNLSTGVYVLKLTVSTTDGKDLNNSKLITITIL